MNDKLSNHVVIEGNESSSKQNPMEDICSITDEKKLTKMLENTTCDIDDHIRLIDDEWYPKFESDEDQLKRVSEWINEIPEIVNDLEKKSQRYKRLLTLYKTWVIKDALINAHENIAFSKSYPRNPSDPSIVEQKLQQVNQLITTYIPYEASYSYENLLLEVPMLNEWRYENSMEYRIHYDAMIQLQAALASDFIDLWPVLDNVLPTFQENLESEIWKIKDEINYTKLSPHMRNMKKLLTRKIDISRRMEEISWKTP